MGKHMRALAILLVLSVLAGYLPAKKSLAESYNIACGTKSGTFYVNTPDEAFDILERDGGGTITLQTTFDWTTAKVRKLTKNMKIVIPDYALLKLSGAGIQGEGSIQVYGTLDLKNSTCSTFHITGKIEKIGKGEIIRQIINVGSLDKISDTAAVITYGQTLPGTSIDDNLIGTRVYKPGKWLYRDRTTVLEAGTHTVTVYYDYNMTIFSPALVEEDVQIQVDKAVPKLSQYIVPEIELGQKLGSVHPKFSFINPYTNEQVAGTLTFADADSAVTGLGEKQIKAVFIPNDSKNYSKAELTLQINVVSASPKIAVLPNTGNGQYGQTLEDIVLSNGSCVDAQTGETVEGSWSWKNKTQPLQCGTHTYQAVFTPKDEVNYKAVEGPVSVQTSPKKMTAVEWPSVSGMYEGQHLFEASLSFASNEYGNFVWEDETQIPTMDYKGAVLRFVPHDTENYDWSYVTGYDAELKCVKKTVPLQINPKPTATPVPTTAPTPVPTEAPTCAPTASPAGTPEVTAPATATATAAPAESPKPTATAAATATAVPTESPKPTETAAATATTAPAESPKPTAAAAATATAVPTERPKPTAAAAATATTAPITVTPTAAPQSSQPGESDDGKTDDTDEPVVIKKMVSTISKIKTPTSGNAFSSRSRIRTVKRSGRTVKIIVKKVKGAKYEVRYGQKKNMKKGKKKRFSKNTLYIRNLKAGKTYYIQTRVLKKKKGKYVYGKWSKKRKI